MSKFFLLSIPGAFVAAIYVTLEETMAGEFALLWGVGISLVTSLINVIIACFPIYPIL